jgi:HAD superfamily hydrolase (TIGR01549 family)
VNRPIDALICDMDGTLFDSMGPVTSSFIETIVAGGGPRYTPQDIIAAFPKGSARPMLSELLGRPCTDADLQGYHRRLAEASRETIPYEGIPEALDTLAAAGIRLALFTGADVPSLQMLLRGTDLLDRFEVLVGGDEVPHAKPAPDGILLACRRLRIDPSNAAYLGDSAPDMAAATAAGALAIAPEWGHLYHPTHPAHLHAATPSDLVTILTT